jgi:hypothetical protein
MTANENENSPLLLRQLVDYLTNRKSGMAATRVLHQNFEPCTSRPGLVEPSEEVARL